MIFDNPHPEWPIEPNCCSFHYPLDGDCWHGGPVKPSITKLEDGQWQVWLPPQNIEAYTDVGDFIAPWGYTTHPDWQSAYQLVQDAFPPPPPRSNHSLGLAMDVDPDDEVGLAMVKLAEVATTATEPTGEDLGQAYADRMSAPTVLTPDDEKVIKALLLRSQIAIPEPIPEADEVAVDEPARPPAREADPTVDHGGGWKSALAVLAAAAVVGAIWLFSITVGSEENESPSTTVGLVETAPSGAGDTVSQDEMDEWLEFNAAALELLPPIGEEATAAFASGDPATIDAACRAVPDRLGDYFEAGVGPSPDDEIEMLLSQTYDAWTGGATACIAGDLAGAEGQFAGGTAALVEANRLLTERYG